MGTSCTSVRKNRVGRWMVQGGVFATCALLAGTGWAQAWPQKNIRVIIGFAAGGTPDFAIRIVAPKLAEALGQPVIVENRPGAGASTAMEVAARSPADGYTLAVGTLGSLLFSKALFPKAQFDPITSFDPISFFAKTTFIGAVTTTLPIKSVKEFIAYAKANPGKLSYGSSTPGSPPHIVAEMFKSIAGVDLLGVTFKGSADAGAAFMAGTVQVIFDAYPTIGPLVTSGKAVPLVVTGSNRNKDVPNVPTASEAGIPEFTVESWIGLVGVAGTPEPILRRLNTEVVKIMATKQAQDGMEKIGLEPASNTIEQFRAVIKADWPKWSAAIRAAGVTSN
jgi:tripartite-type tricarboxylate transporter receptor subunit TctC